MGPPIPGSPWFKLRKQETNSVQSSSNVVFLPSITQEIVIQSNYSVNPGVLVSGRRPDRPGS